MSEDSLVEQLREMELYLFQVPATKNIGSEGYYRTEVGELAADAIEALQLGCAERESQIRFFRESLNETKAEIATLRTQWISVEDETPPGNEHLLIVTSEGHLELSFNLSSSNPIALWMRAPPPPEDHKGSVNSITGKRHGRRYR